MTEGRGNIVGTKLKKKTQNEQMSEVRKKIIRGIPLTDRDKVIEARLLKRRERDKKRAGRQREVARKMREGLTLTAEEKTIEAGIMRSREGARRRYREASEKKAKRKAADDKAKITKKKNLKAILDELEAEVDDPVELDRKRELIKGKYGESYVSKEKGEKYRNIVISKLIYKFTNSEIKQKFGVSGTIIQSAMKWIRANLVNKEVDDLITEQIYGATFRIQYLWSIVKELREESRIQRETRMAEIEKGKHDIPSKSVFSRVKERNYEAEILEYLKEIKENEREIQVLIGIRSGDVTNLNLLIEGRRPEPKQDMMIDNETGELIAQPGRMIRMPEEIVMGTLTTKTLNVYLNQAETIEERKQIIDQAVDYAYADRLD